MQTTPAHRTTLLARTLTRVLAVWLVFLFAGGAGRLVLCVGSCGHAAVELADGMTCCDSHTGEERGVSDGSHFDGAGESQSSFLVCAPFLQDPDVLSAGRILSGPAGAAWQNFSHGGCRDHVLDVSTSSRMAILSSGDGQVQSVVDAISLVFLPSWLWPSAAGSRAAPPGIMPQGPNSPLTDSLPLRI